MNMEYQFHSEEIKISSICSNYFSIPIIGSVKSFSDELPKNYWISSAYIFVEQGKIKYILSTVVFKTVSQRPGLLRGDFDYPYD